MINIYILTWNVAGISPQEGLNFKNQFFNWSENGPDIVVVGLQEIVDLNNAMNIIA